MSDDKIVHLGHGSAFDLRAEEELLAAELRILAALIDTIEVMDFAAQERVLAYMQARLAARRKEEGEK